MAVKPLGDRVIVERLEDKQNKTEGGIIIPDTVKEKPMQGNVVSVGPGSLNEQGERVAMEVKAGDRVLFGKYAGTEVKIEGKEMLIMRESDILAVLG